MGNYLFSCITKGSANNSHDNNSHEIECPVCLKSKTKFKKLHSNPSPQPAHFICSDCYTLYKQYNPNKLPPCPLCQQPIYTHSFSHYYQCEDCQQLVKDLFKNNGFHMLDKHSDRTLCQACAYTKEVCPFCGDDIDFTNPWN